MASKSRKPIDLGFDDYNELFMTEQERIRHGSPHVFPGASVPIVLTVRLKQESTILLQLIPTLRLSGCMK